MSAESLKRKVGLVDWVTMVESTFSEEDSVEIALLELETLR
jgi:hypothetical protein